MAAPMSPSGRRIRQPHHHASSSIGSMDDENIGRHSHSKSLFSGSRDPQSDDVREQNASMASSAILSPLHGSRLNRHDTQHQQRDIFKVPDMIPSSTRRRTTDHHLNILSPSSAARQARHTSRGLLTPPTSGSTATRSDDGHGREHMPKESTPARANGRISHKEAGNEHNRFSSMYPSLPRSMATSNGRLGSSPGSTASRKRLRPTESPDKSNGYTARAAQVLARMGLDESSSRRSSVSGDTTTDTQDEEAHTRDRVLLLPTSRARDLSRWREMSSMAATSISTRNAGSSSHHDGHTQRSPSPQLPSMQSPYALQASSNTPRQSVTPNKSTISDARRALSHSPQRTPTRRQSKMAPSPLRFSIAAGRVSDSEGEARSPSTHRQPSREPTRLSEASALPPLRDIDGLEAPESVRIAEMGQFDSRQSSPNAPTGHDDTSFGVLPTPPRATGSHPTAGSSSPRKQYSQSVDRRLSPRRSNASTSQSPVAWKQHNLSQKLNDTAAHFDLYEQSPPTLMKHTRGESGSSTLRDEASLGLQGGRNKELPLRQERSSMSSPDPRVARNEALERTPKKRMSPLPLSSPSKNSQAPSKSSRRDVDSFAETSTVSRMSQRVVDATPRSPYRSPRLTYGRSEILAHLSSPRNGSEDQEELHGDETDERRDNDRDASQPNESGEIIGDINEGDLVEAEDGRNAKDDDHEPPQRRPSPSPRLADAGYENHELRERNRETSQADRDSDGPSLSDDAAPHREESMEDLDVEYAIEQSREERPEADYLEEELEADDTEIVDEESGEQMYHIHESASDHQEQASGSGRDSIDIPGDHLDTDLPVIIEENTIQMAQAFGDEVTPERPREDVQLSPQMQLLSLTPSRSQISDSAIRSPSVEASLRRSASRHNRISGTPFVDRNGLSAALTPSLERRNSNASQMRETRSPSIQEWAKEVTDKAQEDEFNSRDGCLTEEGDDRQSLHHENEEANESTLHNVLSDSDGDIETADRATAQTYPADVGRTPPPPIAEHDSFFKDEQGQAEHGMSVPIVTTQGSSTAAAGPVVSRSGEGAISRSRNGVSSHEVPSFIPVLSTRRADFARRNTLSGMRSHELGARQRLWRQRSSLTGLASRNLESLSENHRSASPMKLGFSLTMGASASQLGECQGRDAESLSVDDVDLGGMKANEDEEVPDELSEDSSGSDVRRSGELNQGSNDVDSVDEAHDVDDTQGSSWIHDFDHPETDIIEDVASEVEEHQSVFSEENDEVSDQQSTGDYVQRVSLERELEDDVEDIIINDRDNEDFATNSRADLSDVDLAASSSSSDPLEDEVSSEESAPPRDISWAADFARMSGSESGDDEDDFMASVSIERNDIDTSNNEAISSILNASRRSVHFVENEPPLRTASIAPIESSQREQSFSPPVSPAQNAIAQPARSSPFSRISSMRREISSQNLRRRQAFIPSRDRLSKEQAPESDGRSSQEFRQPEATLIGSNAPRSRRNTSDPAGQENYSVLRERSTNSFVGNGSVTMSNLMRHRSEILGTRPSMVEVCSLNREAAARAAAILKLHHKYLQYGSLETDIDDENWNQATLLDPTIMENPQEEETARELSRLQDSVEHRTLEDVLAEKEAEMTIALPDSASFSRAADTSVGMASISLPGAFPPQHREMPKDSALPGLHLTREKAVKKAMARYPQRRGRLVSKFGNNEWASLDDLLHAELLSHANDILRDVGDGEDGGDEKAGALYNAVLLLNRGALIDLYLEVHGLAARTVIGSEWSVDHISRRITVLTRRFVRKLQEKYSGLQVAPNVADSFFSSSRPSTPRSAAIDESALTDSSRQAPFRMVVESTPAPPQPVQLKSRLGRKRRKISPSPELSQEEGNDTAEDEVSEGIHSESSASSEAGSTPSPIHKRNVRRARNSAAEEAGESLRNAIIDASISASAGATSLALKGLDFFSSFLRRRQEGDTSQSRTTMHVQDDSYMKPSTMEIPRTTLHRQHLRAHEPEMSQISLNSSQPLGSLPSIDHMRDPLEVRYWQERGQESNLGNLPPQCCKPLDVTQAAPVPRCFEPAQRQQPLPMHSSRFDAYQQPYAHSAHQMNGHGIATEQLPYYTVQRQASPSFANRDLDQLRVNRLPMSSALEEGRHPPRHTSYVAEPQRQHPFHEHSHSGHQPSRPQQEAMRYAQPLSNFASSLLQPSSSSYSTFPAQSAFGSDPVHMNNYLDHAEPHASNLAGQSSNLSRESLPAKRGAKHTPVRRINSGQSVMVQPTMLALLSPHTHQEARDRATQFRASREQRKWRSPRKARQAYGVNGGVSGLLNSSSMSISCSSMPPQAESMTSTLGLPSSDGPRPLPHNDLQRRAAENNALAFERSQASVVEPLRFRNF